MGKLLCDKCRKEIRYGNLAVSAYGILGLGIPLTFKKFHNSCFAKHRKTVKGRFIYSRKPLNSVGYGLKLKVLGIGGLFLGSFLTYMFIESMINFPQLAEASLTYTLVSILIIIFSLLAFYELHAINKLEKSVRR